MSERLDRYLSREAFDYLEQIEAALRTGAAPDAGLLRRLSGGVRGSARMAGIEGVEVVAGRMEAALEALIAGGEPWPAGLTQLIEATVGDLRKLVAAAERWSATEDERVRVAMERWDAMPGGGTETEVDVVPIEDLLLADPPTDDRVVPVESLLLRPSDALRLALAMRTEMSRQVRALPGGEVLDDTLAELFELLEIAARGEHPPA